jgi:hypothetical protein
LLLTVLLVLAIGASSALVFTNKVELLKLAVILALWAAVAAAFASVIYRRQSDADQAKVRDLKLVYDLQLDREISARREYELSVETQLRRELVSELRSQAADEVAGLRAELAALRANLEILFDADLSDRPALEHDRAGSTAYSDWSSGPKTTGRVTASRIDDDGGDDNDFRTDESPIIDVPEEPHLPEFEWAPPPNAGGVHRRPSEAEGRRYRAEEPSAWSPPRPSSPPPAPPPPPPRSTVPPPTDAERTTQFTFPPVQEPPAPAAAPEPPAARPEPEPPAPAPEPEPPARPEPEPVSGPTSSPDWQPAPAAGQWIPAGAPGSNWVAPGENGSSDEYVGRRRAPEPSDEHAQPMMSTPPPEPRRGRHSAPSDVADPGRPPTPTLAAEPAQPPPHPQPEPSPESPEPSGSSARPRHRSVDDEPQTGGQSVAELLARLQAAPTGGGRRRRRDE